MYGKRRHFISRDLSVSRKPLGAAPIIESPLYVVAPKKSVKERLDDALIFLKRGKEEIADGRKSSNDVIVREGCEKVFHALLETTVARIQKYGLGIPQNHDEIRERLKVSGEMHKEFEELRKDYQNAFLYLHVGAYYKGWLDKEAIDKQVSAVENRILKLEKVLRR